MDRRVLGLCRDFDGEDTGDEAEALKSSSERDLRACLGPGDGESSRASDVEYPFASLPPLVGDVAIVGEDNGIASVFSLLTSSFPILLVSTPTSG